MADVSCSHLLRKLRTDVESNCIQDMNTLATQILGVLNQLRTSVVLHPRPDTDELDDAVANVSQRLLDSEKLKTVVEAGDPAGYAVVCLRNHIADKRRRNARRPERVVDPQHMEEIECRDSTTSVDDKDALDFFVSRIIQGLRNPTDVELFRCIYLRGMSGKEAAEELKIKPISALYKRTSRLRKQVSEIAQDLERQAMAS